MECTKCHINVKDPLELYTGEMACPKCRSQLTMVPRRISAQEPRAQELFYLAELYYHYSLCKNAKLPVTDLIDKSAMTSEDMLDKAIYYCQEALKLGHPEALWRMAFFYDKDYIEKDSTESVRCRIAAHLYLAIVTATDIQFTGYGSTREETDMLKRRAADDLFSMLKGMSRRDRKIYAEKLTEHGYLTQEAAKELAEQAERSGAEELISMLSRATSKRRAPLFGIIRIRKEQLEKIKSEIVESPVVVNRKISLMFIPLNSDDKYDFRNSLGGKSPFHIARVSADAVKKGISLAVEKSAEYCCVYFFNKAGKHRFYNSASKRNKLEKTISGDLIDKLISSTPGHSYIFNDDDVFFKNNRADKIIAEITASAEA